MLFRSDPETAAEFKAHLQHCAGCCEALKELQGTATLVDQLPEESVAAEVIQGVLKQSMPISWNRNAINKLKLWWTAATDLRLPWAVAAAAASAIIIISLWTMTLKPDFSPELLAWDVGIEDDLDYIELQISEMYSEQDQALNSGQNIQTRIDLIESNMRSLSRDLETMTF